MTLQSRAEQSSAEQSTAGQSRAEQNRAEQSRAEQSTAQGGARKKTPSLMLTFQNPQEFLSDEGMTSGHAGINLPAVRPDGSTGAQPKQGSSKVKGKK